MLKASTAANVMVLLVDSTDHITGKASLSLTITASKDGAAFASITPTVTERGSGWYSLALTTSHTDTLGDLAVHITGTGADPSDLACRVVAVDHADAVSFGLSRLDAAITSRTKPADTQARVTLVDTVTTLTGNTAQTGDNYARIGAAGAGLTALGDTRIANLDATVSSRSTYAGADTSGTTTLLARVPGTVQAQTGDSYARLGAAGAGLTALGDARLANLDAAVSTRSTLTAAQANTEADTALADYDAPTNAEMVARTLPSASYALEATLTAIKGGSWSVETLKAIYDAVGLRLLASGYTAPDNAGIATAASFAISADAKAADLQSRVPAALVSGRIDASVGAMATDTLTSVALAASAVSEIAAAIPPLSAGDVRAALGMAAADLDTQLDAILAGGGGGGGGSLTAADVWDYTTRTLTAAVPAGAVQANVPGGPLRIYKGDTYAETITSITVPAAWTRLHLCIKRYQSQPDSESLVELVVSNPSDAGDGLTVLNGAAPGVGQTGTLAVAGSLDSLVVVLSDDATALLKVMGNLHYGIKTHDSAASTSRTLSEGGADVLATSVLAIG